MKSNFYAWFCIVLYAYDSIVKVVHGYIGKKELQVFGYRMVERNFLPTRGALDCSPLILFGHYIEA